MDLPVEQQLAAAKLQIDTLLRLLKEKTGTPEMDALALNEKATHRVVCNCTPTQWSKFLSSAKKMRLNGATIFRSVMDTVIAAGKE